MNSPDLYFAASCVLENVPRLMALSPIFVVASLPWLLLGLPVWFATLSLRPSLRLATRAFPLACAFAPYDPNGCFDEMSHSFGPAYLYLLAPQDRGGALCAILILWAFLTLVAHSYSAARSTYEPPRVFPGRGAKPSLLTLLCAVGALAAALLGVYSLRDESRHWILASVDPLIARVILYVLLLPMFLLYGVPWLIVEVLVVYATRSFSVRRKIAARCLPLAIGFAPVYPMTCTLDFCDPPMPAYYLLFLGFDPSDELGGRALASIAAAWATLCVVGTIGREIRA